MRTKTFTLLSGVPCTIRSLIGRDQETLTKQDGAKANSQFNELLADAVVAIGDDRNITVDKIEKMLTNDRRHVLVNLRQFTVRDKKTFKFTYEWPITSGDKDNQEYEINLSDENFPYVPYKWVLDEISDMDEQDLKEFESENGTIYNAKSNKSGAIPVVYENYDEMLSSELNRVFKTSEEQEIHWEIQSGITEKKWSNFPKSKMSSLTPLEWHNPKYVFKKDESGKNMFTKWDVRKADYMDVEDFRIETKNVEGDIDTYITIENQNDPSKIKKIDLVSTVEFFFPSQAI